ncbi:MAG: hypothetical protein IJ043_03125 [Clostridia bacterium]|nr:hypothetical protein [Clostridia bacterium]
MNWDEIKTEYIAGDTSYRKLAAKHGVPFTTLKRIAGKEDWVGLRKRAKAKADTIVVNSAAKDRADKLKGVLKTADGLSDLITRTVEKINRLDRDMENPVDCKMIKDLTAATRDLTGVIRDLYGLPTEGEKLARQIALERLELEKRRADVEDQNTTVTVVFGTEEGQEAWAQ